AGWRSGWCCWPMASGRCGACAAHRAGTRPRGRARRRRAAVFSPMRPPPRALEGYREAAGEEALQEVRAFAAPLRDMRVLHVSFSPYGTIMAEQLGALVPLLRDLGLEADWQVAS